MRSREAVVVAALLSMAACSSHGPDASGEGTWVGTISTEGGVTTVVNESGSLWGGPATLVEEASIGVETGDDAYMFGDIEGVAMSGERIFVLDRSVPVLRAYDLQGNHLLDMGRGGQGPGEFTNPYLLAASQDGRVFVRTHGGLVVFDIEGNHLMTLNERGGIVLPMVAGGDGTLYMPVSWAVSTPGEIGSGHLPIAPDGTRGERIVRPSLVEWEPWTLIARADGRMRQQSVPHAPGTVWTVAPDGAMIQAASDTYRIEVRHSDGTTRVIQRVVEAVPVTEAQRSWHAQMTRLIMRRIQPDWTWNANPIPASKPYFSRFYTDPEGVLWVRRIVRTETVTDCDTSPQIAIEEQRPPRPCFRDVEGFDVFGTDGRYMGAVELPRVTMHDQPAIDGDNLVMAVEDEAGTIMVKRYRLTLPGKPGG
jgi:hypothetical protein